MSISSFEVTRFIFRASCFITVLCMISLWTNKFLQDDDLCLVEYKSFSAVDDIELPDVSFCISDPFDKHKLNVLDTTVDAYRKHLSGDEFNDSLAIVHFREVSFNVGDYYNGTQIIYRDGTNGYVVNGTVRSRQRGFYFGMFMECYGIDTENINVYDVHHMNQIFIRDPKLQNFLSSNLFFVVAHLPSQILLSTTVKVASLDINGTYGGNLGVSITSAEVVRRRNKRIDPCVMQWRIWNDLALSKYVEDIRCFPPYLEINTSYPMCTKT